MDGNHAATNATAVKAMGTLTKTSGSVQFMYGLKPVPFKLAHYRKGRHIAQLRAFSLDWAFSVDRPGCQSLASQGKGIS